MISWAPAPMRAGRRRRFAPLWCRRTGPTRRRRTWRWHSSARRWESRRAKTAPAGEHRGRLHAPAGRGLPAAIAVRIGVIAVVVITVAIAIVVIAIAVTAAVIAPIAMAPVAVAIITVAIIAIVAVAMVLRGEDRGQGDEADARGDGGAIV